MIKPFRAAALALAFGGACLALPTAAAAPGATGSQTPAAAPSAEPTTATSPTYGAATYDTAIQAAALTDGEILGLMNTVDQHEVDAAEKALKKKMGKEAQDYATMLRDSHKANLEKTRKLAKTANIKAATNKMADSLKAKGKADVKALTAKSGVEFEKGYIDAMVNGHTEVLAMLDTQLIPAAQNMAVKTHISEVRTQIAAHLEQGKRLQGASASAPQPE